MQNTKRYPWLFAKGRELENKYDYNLAIKECGLDYDVHLEEMMTVNGQPISDAKAVVRDDGVVICTTGNKTTLVQNRDKFDFFKGLLETGLVELHAGGIIKNGNRQFMLAKYKQPYVITPGDEVEHFILCSDSYDNSIKVLLLDWAGRIICTNGLAKIASQASIKLRHSKSVNNNVQKFRELLEKTSSDFNKTVEMYRQLAAKKITSEWVMTYIMNVLKIEEGDKVFNSDGTPVKKLDEVQKAMYEGVGQDVNVGTAWWAYNGVTNWLSHVRGRSPETRLESLFWGDSRKLNELALETALSLSI